MGGSSGRGFLVTMSTSWVGAGLGSRQGTRGVLSATCPCRVSTVFPSSYRGTRPGPDSIRRITTQMEVLL